MDSLPMWNGARPLLLSVEQQEPAELDPACNECKLGPHKNTGLRSPCIGGEGEPGGVLLVGESPGRSEDAVGRPFVARGGQLLRRHVDKHWSGPVAYDYAVRCSPGRAKVTASHVGRCRPYLSTTVEEGFKRIVCLGGVAALALTGRSVPPFSCRRGFTYLSNGTPVFFVMHPAMALRNRFTAEQFEADIEWALTATPPRPDFGASAYLVRTVCDAGVALAPSHSGSPEWASFDVETSGRMWCAEFRVVSVALCWQGSSDAYVWDADALADPALRDPLLAWLADAGAPKTGQNVKYDQLAVQDGLGVRVGGVVGDTRLMRRLLEPDASGALDVMAELVGMGGLKQATQATMKKIVSTIKRNLAKCDGDDDDEPHDVGPVVLHRGMTDADTAAVCNGVAPERFMYGLVESPRLSVYNARDAVATTALCSDLGYALDEVPELASVWHKIVLPAANALVDVEGWGVAVNSKALQAFGEHLDTETVKAAHTLSQYGDVNWNSTQQIRALLYEQLKLPVYNHTATGAPSTDAKTLTKLAKRHSLPRALLNYRQLTKLKGTYVDGMWEHIRDDGRIHPNVKLDGAASGRTSCIAAGCMVRTMRGAVPIQLVVVGDFVWTHRERWRYVLAVMVQGVRPTIAMTLTNGEVLTCTSDHRLLGGDCGWLEAGVCGVGKCSASLFAGEGRPLVACVQIQAGGSADVYDLTVDEDESFEVCGVYAHNCRDPNLQNIPRATSDLGRMLRDVFVASPGGSFVELDYSQLELRVAAMLSGDEVMREIFTSGVDYHLRTAQLVSQIAWGVAPELVTSEHRTQAKAINFGVLYGMSDPALAANLGCSIAQAGRVRAAVMGKFKRLERWCKEQLRETRRTGYTWTWWDGKPARRRPLTKVADVDSESRSRAENGSWNTPVQGTASDFCVRSIAECVEWIVGDDVPGVKLVLSVHDSLLFDVQDDMVEETLATARAIMCSWPSSGVPLVVDAKVGKSWGSMVDVKEET